MGFVGLIVIGIVLLIVGIVEGDSDSNVKQTSASRRSSVSPKIRVQKRRSSVRHRESHRNDSWYDRNGDEHEVDDDGYCEECDDHHDN